MTDSISSENVQWTASTGPIYPLTPLAPLTQQWLSRPLPLRGIAFYGPIGSGKSTMAEFLSRYANNQRAAFADGVRYEAVTMLTSILSTQTPYPLDLWQEMTDPKTKEKYRPLLQWLGTDYRRAQDPDYWVKKLVTRIDPYPELTWLIDDCRFTNEYNALRDRKFVFVHLASNPAATAPQSHGSVHASETEWHNFAYEITLPWTDVSNRINTLFKKLTELLGSPEDFA